MEGTLAIMKPSSGLTMYCARYPTPIGTGFFMHCAAADARKRGCHASTRGLYSFDVGHSLSWNMQPS